MLDLTTIDPSLLVTRKANNGNNIVVYGRMSWPKLFKAEVNKADAGKENALKKFNLNLLIPPSADLKYLKLRCQETATDRWGDKVATMKLKSPFLKAEDYKYEGHLPGWTYLRLSAITKPQVVEAKNGVMTRITEEDPEIVYSGRWAQVTINPFAYPKAGAANLGNNGISLGLNNVLLLQHDESLGGRMKAEDEFESAGAGFESAEAAGVENLF